MKRRSWTRWLVTITTCSVSGALSGYILIRPGAGNILFLPIELAMGGPSKLTLLLQLLQFFSPGIIFGLAFSMSAILGNRIENRPVNIIHASLSVVVYTVASTVIWFITYWVAAIPFNSGLRNLIIPGAIAGLLGGFSLSVAALVLPNARARWAILWTAGAGAIAGLLFFLNPALRNDLASTSANLFPIVAWCVSFALWQGAVGAALAISMDLSEARGKGTNAVAGAVAEAGRRVEPETPAGQDRGAFPKKRNAGLLRIGAALGLLAVVLFAAALWGGITISNHRPLLTLNGHGNQFDDIAFSPNGTRLATAGADSTAKLWDAATGTELFVLPSGPVGHVVFSPDGARLFTAGWQKTVSSWDTTTGRQLLSLTTADNIQGLAVSPDGQRLATSGYEGTIEIWDANSGANLHTFTSVKGQLRNITFSPDGTRLATANFLNDTALVWDAATGRELLTLRGHTVPVEDVAFSPDGTLLVTGSQDGSAKIWDATTGKELRTLIDSNWQGGSVYSVAFSPDGRRLATADTTAKVWEVASGKQLLTLSDGTSGITAVAFNPDGTRLATASSYKTANVWNVQP